MKDWHYLGVSSEQIVHIDLDLQTSDAHCFYPLKEVPVGQSVEHATLVRRSWVRSSLPTGRVGVGKM